MNFPSYVSLLAVSTTILTAQSRSVPSGQATSDVIPLSLSDAMDRGLKHNLGLITGDQAARLAEAARLRALSGLLPNINARSSETSQQVNLKALGFGGFPGFPSVIGPFRIFDVRAYLSQSIFDYSAIAANRSGSENVKAARLAYQNARDAVVLAVVSLYLQAIMGTARIESASAQVTTANALFKQATDLKNAGVMAGIDVLRAQVEMQAEQQRLIFHRNEFEKHKLNLARAIGLPLGQQFRLSDRIPYGPPPTLALETALQQAYETRPDYQSALAAERAAELQKKAAQAERLPSLYFDGNYGAIGSGPFESHGTFVASVGVRVPVFDGGRIKADVLRADAELEQRKAETGDLRGRIDYEVRTAFLDLKAGGDQVEVAQSALQLANEQVRHARDRFQAGVANSIEVVQAQQALAAANENYTSALFAYNLAKASIARALGVSEKRAKEFLGATAQ
ncbi:MAG TPA: TolC family protein [Bryobacteraceae bacterium]|nr:TolC family protein [Bryobacteraceae bacterium]